MGIIEERPGEVSLGRAWRDYFVGYVDFKGRSTRTGFWWIFSFIGLAILIFLIVIFLPFINMVLTNKSTTPEEMMIESITRMFLPLFIGFAVTLGLFLPTVALVVRRMRDIGIRGRGQLVVMGIYLLITMLLAAYYVSKDNTKLLEDGIDKLSIIRTISTGIIIILSFLPTGSFATTKESGFTAFFFKNKRFYEDSEL